MSENSGRASTVIVGIGALLAVAALVVAGYVVGFNRGDNGGGGGGAQTTSAGPSGGPGQQAFSEKCGSCHILAAAGTTGATGPDLDQLKPAEPVVLAQIKNGGGAMPAGLATGKEAQQIAQYVAKSVGQ